MAPPGAEPRRRGRRWCRPANLQVQDLVPELLWLGDGGEAIDAFLTALGEDLEIAISQARTEERDLRFHVGDRLEQRRRRPLGDQALLAENAEIA